MYCFQRHRQSVLVAALALVATSCGEPGDQADAADDAAGDSTVADSAAVDSSALADSSVLADSSAADRDAVPVETANAIRGDISSYLIFSSTVETEAAIEIHPEVSGQVEQVLVEEGDQVQAGQILVHLDNEQASLEQRESAVNLQHLEVGFERTQQMHARKLISAQEYEDKLFQLEQARLRHERAQLELAHTEIRAPFSGVLTSREVQVGARVGPGAKLFDLVKLDDMIARVHVPGRYIRIVERDQVAEVESDFLEDMTFGGYVKRISPVVDPKSGTFKVTVGLHDQWEHLRPGMFVNVRIVIDTHANTVLVPKQAVVYDGSDRYVFVVDDSTARRVQLDAGYENSRFVEARTDIDAETPIIVVGQNGLKDKARVKVVHVASAPASEG